jgi:energy-coupling factor transporter transmembrane protein EcfT
LSERNPPTPPVHPIARGLAVLIAATGSILVREPVALALFWLAVLVPLLVHTGIIRAHIRFVCGIVLPVAAALFLVWGWIVAAPPGAPPGSDPAAGLRFAATTSLRLAVLGGVWQSCFLTLPSSALAATLRCWGLQGEALVVVLGSFAVVPELTIRSRQVIVARVARGFISDARWWSRIRQVPSLLPPLVAWVLRSSVQRGEQWRHRGMLQRFEDDRRLRDGPWSRARSVSLVAVATGWLLYAIASRWV